MLRVSGILIDLVTDMLRWLRLAFRSSQSIQAENLFLRRQLALYNERGVKPRRIDAATRIALTVLSRLFDWRDALAVVSPATLIRWHRAGWRLFWRMRSRPGRPPIPPELQALIRRIANELLLKIGIRVSPRSVNKYLPRRPRGRPRGDLRWLTFLRLHAQGIIACDLFVAVTATFRLLYVLIVIEHRSRRLIHYNVTAHPSVAWTLQQLREAVGYEEQYRFLIHDRDGIFSGQLDESIRALGIRVLKSAPHSPKMNAVCERVIGTLRRECLDWVIPCRKLSCGQPFVLGSSITIADGPIWGWVRGFPIPPTIPIARPTSRHRRGEPYVVRADPILGGLHHEYALATA